MQITVPTKIVGIMLVHNEDVFIEHALAGATDFCDEMIIADHMSQDRTQEICLKWAKQDNRIRYHRIANAAESHDFLQPYIGTPTWIFGVDGDEIYDRAGLAHMRQELLAGKYMPYWIIKGHVLHCTALKHDGLNASAQGYLAPPSRSMTKLMNFYAITEWRQCRRERLHEGNLIFRPEYQRGPAYRFGDHVGWDDSYLRCLHTCFLKRSSQDSLAGMLTAPRYNLDERPSQTLRTDSDMRSLLGRAIRFFQFRIGSKWKRREYRKGPLIQKDAAPFFAR